MYRATGDRHWLQRVESCDHSHNGPYIYIKHIYIFIAEEIIHLFFTECPAGHYGMGCMYNCSTNCKIGQCDHVDGECACVAGHTGNMCQLGMSLLN